mmetsp:Transcript_94709/g.165415  ORF Transcript_94709/g.165415 Transcript_94709/m.165415 type:complete len:90 (-) Transcript_94709:174-443(-)
MSHLILHAWLLEAVLGKLPNVHYGHPDDLSNCIQLRNAPAAHQADFASHDEAEDLFFALQHGTRDSLHACQEPHQYNPYKTRVGKASHC